MSKAMIILHKTFRMKQLLALILITCFYALGYGQVYKGSHYISFGNSVINAENDWMKDYPIEQDTNATSTSAANLEMSWHVNVLKPLSIGVRSKFFTSPTSSFKLSSVGPVARLCFNPGKDKDTAYSYLEVGTLFGNVKYDSITTSYKSTSIVVGGIIRAPFPEAPVLKRMGLELSFGVNMAWRGSASADVTPILRGGLVIFLDKKHANPFDF